MPLGTTIQLSWRPTWPDPEQSIGREFGEIPNTRFSYWQAQGPALAAYQKLLPKIHKVLDEKQGPIPNSDFVWFAIYMVGPSPTTAVPYIMFASEQKPQRKKAMAYIKNSKILQEYPGMKVGQWPEAPHIGSQQQKASSGERAYGNLERPYSITIDHPFSTEAHMVAVLYFHYPDRTVKATASVQVKINDIAHYLVPSHVLLPPRPSIAAETEAPEELDDDGVDFGDFMGDDDLSDDDPLVTSLASISSSGSDSGQSEEQSLGDNSVESTTINSNSESSNVIAEPSLNPNSSSLEEAGVHASGDEVDTSCPVVSIPLDYALCRLTDGNTYASPRRLPDLLEISEDFVEPGENGMQVQALTMHGRLKGHLFRTGTHVHLPNSSSYQEVFVAHFDSPVRTGDCGTMVYDAQGIHAIGHIITGSANSTKKTAFVVPVQHVHKDIVRQLGKLSLAGARVVDDSSLVLQSRRAGPSSESLVSLSSSAQLHVEQTVGHIHELGEQSDRKTQAPKRSHEDLPGLLQEGWNKPTLGNTTSYHSGGPENLILPYLSKRSKDSNLASSAAVPQLVQGAEVGHAGPSFQEINASGPEQLGLNVVHTPVDEPKVDIIFVHGFRGTSRGTWSKHADPALFWPSTFLPLESEMGSARIMTFGYNSGLKEISDRASSVQDFAKSLLFDLKYGKANREEDVDIGKVPLIFVAHSLGGLVVKEAYVRGQADPEYGRIINAISAIIFLGTPHRGTNVDQTLNRILSIFSSKEYTAKHAKGSLDLQKLNEQFRHLSPGLHIVSFYETRPVLIGSTQVMVADKDSSILGYPGEICIPLDADHRSICKYESPTDPNYTAVRNTLRSLVRKTVTEHQAIGGTFLPRQTGRALRDLESLLGVSEPPDVDYNFFRDQWTEGTNDWILRDESFVRWRDAKISSHRMLWLSGGPGTGKSVLSSFVVNSLVENGALCQYFFIRFGNRGKRGLSVLLRYFAYQVAQSLPGFLHRLSELKDETIDFKTAHPMVIWDRIFKSIIFKLRAEEPIYWVIDGLDEAEDPQAVVKMLSEISQSSLPIRILFAGRRTMGITAAFQKFAGSLGYGIIEIQASRGHRDDLHRHIHEKLALGGGAGFAEDIKRRIVDRSEGNFLWASLVVKKMSECFTELDMERAQEELPVDMEALYDRMASSIATTLRAEDKSLAVLILQCVTCSLRVLKVSELSQAVGKAASGIADFQSLILDICSGLVVLDDDGNAAMVHQTARNYLLQPESLNGGKQAFRIDRQAANKALFLSCMECLMTTGLSKKLARSEPPEFLNYASQFWSSHLVSSSIHDPEVARALRGFLTDERGYVLVWIHALALDGQLRFLIRASQDLSRFAAKYKAQDPLGHTIFENWAIDFPRIVGRFSNVLRRKPDSIYYSIPAFCPKGTVVYQQFGKRGIRDLTVSGLLAETWDDSLARISLGHGPGNTSALSMVTAGSRIAVLDTAGRVFLYDSSDFREATASPITPSERTHMIALSSTATLLATYDNRWTKVWQVHTGNCVATIHNAKWGVRPLDMLFTNYNSTLLVGTDDLVIQSVELRSTRPVAWKVVAELGDKSGVLPAMNKATHMTLSQDGDMVAVSHRGLPLTMWEMSNPGLCWTYDDGGGGTPTIHGVRKLAWQPHQDRILGLSDEQSLFKWSPFENEMDHRSSTATTLSMSLDGVLFATGDDRGQVLLYETATLSVLYQLDAPDAVLDLAFSPDSRRFYDVRVSCVNFWEPNVLTEFAGQSSQETDAMSTAQTLWSSSSEATVIVSGQMKSITALAGSPNGRLYCCATGDGVVTLHDTQDRNHVDIYLSSTYTAIEHICWSSDGKLICFTDEDNQVTMMSIAQWIADKEVVTELPATTLPRKAGKIHQLLFFPEMGCFLICTSSKIYAISSSHSMRQSQTFDDEQIRWIEHPAGPEFILGFGGSTIYILDWDLTEVQRYQISWPWNESVDSKTDIASNLTSSNTNLHIPGRILVTHDKQHIVLQMLPPKLHKRAQQLYFLCTNALSIPAEPQIAGHPREQTSVPPSICPSTFPTDLASDIEIPLDFLPRDRLVFLSKNFAVCSVKFHWTISSSKPSYVAGPSRTTAVTGRKTRGRAKGSPQELFALPGDWVGEHCLATCSIWAVEKSLLCPRNGEVAIVKCTGLI